MLQELACHPASRTNQQSREATAEEGDSRLEQKNVANQNGCNVMNVESASSLENLADCSNSAALML